MKYLRLWYVMLFTAIMACGLTACGDDDDEEGNIPTIKLVKSITLSAKSIELKKGETKVLTITVSPSDAANKNVVWTSNNPAIAFPNQSGLVTTVNVGNCVITCQATDGSGVKAECKVTVKENPDSGSDDSGNEDPEERDIHVIVRDDGTTSNGSIFSAIDDKNFYIDYIKYTVTEGHLAVSGYDKTGFKGVAKIISKLTYKGNTYEVLGIGNAFRGRSILTSIIIPNSVKVINWSAFDGCSSLTSITIGNSVTSIGYYAFSGCSSMTDVYCYATTPPTASYYVDDGGYRGYLYAFDTSYIKTNTTLHVPSGSITSYKAAEPWKSFKSIVAL